MTVDEALDEWALGQHRQPFRSCGVQRGFDEQCSQAFPRVSRVDLGVNERDPPTAISKRLRPETSVTVGVIASDCARHVLGRCL